MTTARMAVRWVFVATIISILLFGVGCGDTFRVIATPITGSTGNPEYSTTVTVVHTNGTLAGRASNISVAGDMNSGNMAMGVAPGWAAYPSSGTSALYSANSGEDTVSYSSSSNQDYAPTITLLTGSKPIAMVAASSGMYVLNSGLNADCPANSSVGVISSSNMLTMDICLPVAPATTLVGIAAAPWTTHQWFGVVTDGKLFVLDQADNKIFVINTTKNVITNTIAVGTAPVFATLSYDGSYLYVVNSGSGNVSVVDVVNEVVVTTVPTGTTPVFAFVDRTLNRLYVANYGSNNVSAFNTSTTKTPIAMSGSPIAVGTGPTTVTTLKDGSAVYVGNSGNNYVTKIMSSGFATKTIDVENTNLPNDTTTEVGGRDSSNAASVVYVAASQDGTKVYAAIQVPGSVTLNPSGSATTVAGNVLNGTVVIDVTTDSKILTVSAPRQDLTCIYQIGIPCPLQSPYQILNGRQ